jgi:hypothetical protein
MKKTLLYIVPSRGRPEVMHDFVKTFYETSYGRADLVIGLDDDDVEYPELPDYPVRYDRNERLRLGGTLNLLAVKYAKEYPYIGFMGDDHRPRTIAWDDKYVQALDAGADLVFGDDKICGPSLPTQIAMNSRIINTLGYMVPPGMIHMYLDNFWLELGKKLDSIQYLPDVIIEHLHPSVGKAEWTAQYKEVNAPEVYSHDLELFERYCASQLDKDVAKLLESV